MKRKTFSAMLKYNQGIFAKYLKRKEKRYIAFHQQDMFNLAE